MDVSIIIVNYNTKQLLADCLRSVYAKTSGIDFEVIVSDNGSSDGSVEMLKADFPQVILIANNANLGFGAANNRGLSVAKGKYIFYLNSDTILLNNAVKIFFDYFEKSGKKENIGALGCNLLDASGNFQISCMDFFSYKKHLSNVLHNVYGFSKLTLLHFLLRKPLPAPVHMTFYEKRLGEVDFISGADLFLRNDANARFDEHIFMYCEDQLLCYLLAKQGKKRLLVDEPKIIHLEGASSKTKPKSIIHEKATFSQLQDTMSRIYMFKKMGTNTIQTGILKFATLLLWLNPYIFPSAKKYIRKMLTI